MLLKYAESSGADVCTCSGRNPSPIIRAEIRRRNGTNANSRIGNGGENLSPVGKGAPDDSILNLRAAIVASCESATRAAAGPGWRSSVVSRPARRGAVSRFAVATASWTARLIPTPPTGDMACAASPMQSSPGPIPLPQSVDLHGQELDRLPIVEFTEHDPPITVRAERRLAKRDNPRS